MTASERAALLSRWIKPSSDSEQDHQARAESMVRKAIKASSAIDGSSYRIYAKGSYPNNTNVRRDSDVDIVVELQDCFYYDYLPGITSPSTVAPYDGGWTPAGWRKAVKDALVASFGATSVSSGKVALNVSAVSGSRPSADVVPSYKYVRYDDARQTKSHVGSCVFSSTGGAKIINWPQQQLDNGRQLNTNSGSRYKYYVRALKNAENVLVKAKTIKELPSYFMECLVYNTPVASLKTGDLDAGFRCTLVAIWDGLEAEATNQTMVEPNWMEYLFRSGQKWTRQQGSDIIQRTWTLLSYG